MVTVKQRGFLSAPDFREEFFSDGSTFLQRAGAVSAILPAACSSRLHVGVYEDANDADRLRRSAARGRPEATSPRELVHLKGVQLGQFIRPCDDQARERSEILIETARIMG